ncbi:hypothetical protein GS885_02385 [Rhodococcus hoagii]|nr:hypothetical protein [Prescottella equi]
MVIANDGLDSLLTTAEAATVFSVTAATIRKWAQLDKIQAVGMDRSGRKLYRLGDIALYERTTRQRAGRAA